jgi:hypothetical protein
MDDWTGLATLIAAVSAAVLSGLSLFFAGRRENRRWKREVLTETMVSLFDASFASIDDAAYQARQAGEDLTQHKERALDARAAELRALTRLRFLARPRVVERAVQLQKAEHVIYDAVFKEAVPPDDGEWNRRVQSRRIARNKLFDAARRNLGLRRTVPTLGWYHGEGPSQKEVFIHEMKRRQSSDSDQRRPLAGRRRTGRP